MRIPMHLGVIPDGNRRWAKKHNLDVEEGYMTGADTSMRLLQEAIKLGIKDITAYGFTIENTKRRTNEYDAYVNALVSLAHKFDEVKDHVSLKIYGNTKSKMFPKELKCFTGVEHDKDKTRVNLLVNYSFKWDIMHPNVNLMTEEIPEIDLVVRWGGRCRLSGFLPYQTAYADIYVVDHLWPDARVIDLHEALKWYSTQDPTKGG